MNQKIKALFFRLNGKKEIPSAKYFVNKSIKYAFVVPFVYFKAKLKLIFNLLPDLNHKQLLFIGGLHRSGTSPLYNLIRTANGVSGISGTTVPEQEGQFLQSVYTPDSEYGLLFGFEKSCHLTEVDQRANSVSRASLLRSWGQFWHNKATCYVEKSPSNIIRARFLQTIFPEGKFLFIVRHPIPYAFAVQKWTNADITTIIQHWLHVHTILLNDAAFIKNYLIVRYEDICDEPQSFRNQIYDNFGIELANTINFEDKNQAYFSRWRSDPRLLSDCISTVSEQSLNILELFSYSLNDTYVQSNMSFDLNRIYQ
ncbi:MAG: sulfotransferase [Colwellia sp.]|nr:sulfotransferase [Colwellia sp.]